MPFSLLLPPRTLARPLISPAHRNPLKAAIRPLVASQPFLAHYSSPRRVSVPSSPSSVLSSRNASLPSTIRFVVAQRYSSVHYPFCRRATLLFCSPYVSAAPLCSSSAPLVALHRFPKEASLDHFKPPRRPTVLSFPHPFSASFSLCPPGEPRHPNHPRQKDTIPYARSDPPRGRRSFSPIALKPSIGIASISLPARVWTSALSSFSSPRRPPLLKLASFSLSSLVFLTPTALFFFSRLPLLQSAPLAGVEPPRRGGSDPRTFEQSPRPTEFLSRTLLIISSSPRSAFFPFALNAFQAGSRAALPRDTLSSSSSSSLGLLRSSPHPPPPCRSRRPLVSPLISLSLLSPSTACSPPWSIRTLSFLFFFLLPSEFFPSCRRAPWPPAPVRAFDRRIPSPSDEAPASCASRRRLLSWRAPLFAPLRLPPARSPLCMSLPILGPAPRVCGAASPAQRLISHHFSRPHLVSHHFASSRFVSTRSLDELSVPSRSPISPHTPFCGSPPFPRPARPKACAGPVVGLPPFRAFPRCRVSSPRVALGKLTL